MSQVHYQRVLAQFIMCTILGYLVAALMFTSYMFGTFILHQYFHRLFVTGMRVRAALISACYEKALRLTLSARAEKTIGGILTMITVDVRKIRDLTPYYWILVSGPFQIAIALYMLYQQISWSVFIAVGAQIAVVVSVAFCSYIYIFSRSFLACMH